MEKAVILGSSSAVPDLDHENTHLLVQTKTRTVLIDCPGSPVIRLEKVGVKSTAVTDIILTHFHPDHVSGFAPLLMGMWLVGRETPLNVYGLSPVIERAQKMMELYDWKRWPNFYPVHFNPVPAEEHTLVLEGEDLRITGSPVDHLIPTMGLRFDFLTSGKSLTYSCDTEPSQAVRRLAQGSNILIHEATGGSVGHTSPQKAGEIAAQAGVGALYLIHYPPQLTTEDTLLARAKETFSGPVYVAHDLMTISL